MKQRTLYIIIGLMLLTGCSSTKIEMGAYHQVPMQRADIMPTPAEVSGKAVKVVIFPPSSGRIRLAISARISHTLASTLEKYLTNAGAEVVDRNLAKKLQKEIQLAEIKGKSDYTGPQVADYAITGTIATANFGSSFTEAKIWQDKKGKWYKIPAICNFSAEVSANLRIYKLPALTYAKNVNIRNEVSRSQETRRSGCYLSKSVKNSLIREAAQAAVRSGRVELQNFFAPKAYALGHRESEKKDIIKISQGTLMGFHTGREVIFYHAKKTTNPITGKVSIENHQTAKGLISDQIGQRYAWVIIDSRKKADQIKLGDYVKVKFQKGIFEGLGDSLNTLAQ